MPPCFSLGASCARYWIGTDASAERDHVVFDLVNSATSDFFTLTSLIHSSGTRDHTYKLSPHCNSVDLYKYFFSQRIKDTWNSLPAKLNDFSSLVRLTCFVRSADLSQFFCSGINRSHFLVVFTALHVMQTRYSDKNSVRLSVCPSVCHTRVLWQNGRKICPDFYTIRKII